MGTIQRFFALKMVIYKTQRKDFSTPDLSRILRKAKNASLPVKDKHYPPITSLKKGRRAAFINKITDLGVNSGVIVEICSYIHGVFPESGAVPFEKTEIDLDALQQKQSGKRSRAGKEEAIYRFRSLIYGDALIIEKVSNTSGINILPYVFRCVLRFINKDESYPLPHLVDVGSRNLGMLISSKGGVEKVVASLLVTGKKPENKFAKLLSNVRKGIRGAEQIQVSWNSESGDLNENDVDAIYDELDDDSLRSVKIVFPGGSSVNDLSKYREQDRYDLDSDSDGRPYVASVHEALKSYLSELRNPRKQGPLTADGKLRDGYYLAGSDDED